jgi:DNA polymerase-3 subunit epsilon
MTRGQDSLLMDIGESSSPLLDGALSDEKLELIVLRPTPDELAAHVQQLEDIDKAANGACLWKKLDGTV